MESLPIKKKVSRVSNRYINRLEIRVNINNYLHPSILQLENHLTIAYCRYYEIKKIYPEPKIVMAEKPCGSES